MPGKLKIELGEVQKTLLLPLWGRAKDYEATYPLLKDSYAHELMSKLDFDFEGMHAMPDQLQINTAVRAYNFDKAIKELLKQHPDATIINLGAGLDTGFQRLDNGRLGWYDLDLEDSMALRRQLIPESERNSYIAGSIFDRSWFKEIKVRGSKVFMMSGGVLAYLDENDIRSLFLALAGEFPGSEYMFEIYSPTIVSVRNQRMQQGGAGIGAPLKWGINSAEEIAAWSPEIKVLEVYPYFSRVPLKPYIEENGLKSLISEQFFNEMKMVKLGLGG